MPQYCYRCSTWFNQLEDFREHCRHHFEETDRYCGILTLRNIVVSAGRCPFCLGDDVLQRWGQFEEVVTSFTTSNEFLQHLEKHLGRLRDLGLQQQHTCPHPVCFGGGAYDFDSLLHHFYDDHGITENLFKATSESSRTVPNCEGKLHLSHLTSL